MSLIPNIERSEAMLGFNDPTLAVGSGADTAKIDLAEGDGFLATLLDVINPLQHIPVVGSLYREITGDEISQAASIAGGALFGGPIGLASATANAIFEQASGDDLMGHAVALFTDGAPDPLLQADAGDAVPNDTEQTQVAALAPLPEPPGTFVVAGQPPLAAHALQAAPVLDRPVPERPVPERPVTQQATTPQPTAPAATPVSARAETDAFLQSLPANWVNEALRDAESLNAALQSGEAPAPSEAKPWVGNAMLDALAKYEAMTQARTDARNNEASR